MTDRGDVTTLGILALRHGDEKDAKGNSWGFFRLVNFAAEWTVAPDEDGLLVERPKKDTVGVLLGGINWPFDPKGGRKLTEWSWAFPAMVEGAARVRPVGTVKTGWQIDQSLDALAAAEPGGVRFPVAWPGVVCAGTELKTQEAAFVPGFIGLVAPHFGGPANLGTSVFELTNSGSLAYRAFLQSFMRLYALPSSSPPKTQEKPPNWAGPFGGIPPMPGQDSGGAGGGAGGSPNWAGPFGGIPQAPDPAAGQETYCLAWQLGTAKGGFYGKGVVADFVAAPPPPKKDKGPNWAGPFGGMDYNAAKLAQLQQVIAVGGAGDFGGVGTPQAPASLPNQGTGPYGQFGGVGTPQSAAALPNGQSAAYGQFGGVGTPQAPASVPGVPQSQYANVANNPVSQGTPQSQFANVSTNPGGTVYTDGLPTVDGGPTPGAGLTNGGGNGTQGRDKPEDPAKKVSEKPDPKDSMSQVLAAMSKTMSGPVDVGDLQDQHQHWINSKGEPLNAAHLSTNTYFKRGKQDCPLDFDGPYGNPTDLGGTEVKVYLCYDPNSTHPFNKGSRVGLWRWKTKVPVDTWEPDYPPGIPWEPEIPQYPGNGRIRDPGGGLLADRREAAGGRFAGSWNEWGTPVFLGIAQSTNAAVPDLRNRKSLTDDRSRAAKMNMPVTGRLEAFGQQLGEKWAYTTPPGASRYPTGTVAGGLAFMPSELGMEQVAAGHEPEACSATTLAVYRARLAFGKPDPTTGAALLGHAFEGDRRGTTLVSAINAAGAASEVMRLTARGVSFAHAGSLAMRAGPFELRGETPQAGEVYVATDKRAMYVALAAGAWTQLAAVA